MGGPLRPGARAGRGACSTSPACGPSAHRLGVRELNVTKGPAFGGPAYTARISPLALRTSQTMRLARLFKGAVYKEDSAQVLLPVPRTPDLAATMVGLLRALVPRRSSSRRPAGCRSRDRR